MPYYPPSGGGGGGGGGGTSISGEVPSGPIDGVNTTFILGHTPLPNTLKVFLNGLRQKQTLDFLFSGATITFVTAPQNSDLLLCDYTY
jgi:hypothetical protein